MILKKKKYSDEEEEKTPTSTKVLKGTALGLGAGAAALGGTAAYLANKYKNRINNMRVNRQSGEEKLSFKDSLKGINKGSKQSIKDIKAKWKYEAAENGGHTKVGHYTKGSAALKGAKILGGAALATGAAYGAKKLYDHIKSKKENKNN